jgi:hypothetical protein
VHRYGFLFNNQPDALIIPVLFCYKNLHFSGNFFAHHQEFSTIHSAQVSFKQVFMTASKQELCLEAVIKTYMKLTSAEGTVENSC